MVDLAVDARVFGNFDDYIDSGGDASLAAATPL